MRGNGQQQPEEIREDGIIWQGSRESLEAWKAYKHEKAIAFVRRGYSVAWHRDGDGWMEVFIPERHHTSEPEICASVKFYNQPSQHGIGGGKISKLSILKTRTDIMAQALGARGEKIRVLFSYD